MIVSRDGLNYELDISEGIDLSIYMMGRFEPATTRALEKLVKPGATVLDIGANIGAHTLRIARSVGPQGRVVCFEPTDYAFMKLMRNISLNRDLMPRVTAIQAFLTSGAADGPPPEIHSSWPLVEDGSVHAQHFGKLKSTTQAAGRALDDVLAELGIVDVDIVKMDVDGFECLVLAGAAHLIRRCQPVFIMELAPYVLEETGFSLKELFDHLVPIGYNFYDEKTGEKLIGDASTIAANIPLGASRNVIARCS